MQSVRSQPPAEPAGPAVTPPADQTYTGTKACTACHFKQFMAWKKTKHATDAFAKLPAKYKTDATCLTCHSTGYGAASGFKDEASTPNLAGTTCEACHGPGSKHVEVAKPFISKKTLTAEETARSAARSTRCCRRTSACAATLPKSTRSIPSTTRSSRRYALGENPSPVA